MENKFGIELIETFKIYENLSKKYNVNLSEIIQIDLNRTGVYLDQKEVKEDFRVRFKGKILDDYPSWYALPVRSMEDTLFHINNGKILFGDIEIGKAEELTLDTCENSYQRGPTLLNLNTKSRSSCGGCKACIHSYNEIYDSTVIKDDYSFANEKDFERFFTEKRINVANLDQIAVVTGLFGKEDKVIEHMKIISDVAKKCGFNGELMYFGCEVNSKDALKELSSLGKFGLIYALDNFSKRDLLLAKIKSSKSIKDAKQVLTNAKKLGIRTTISYISGIDNLEDMKNGFIYLKDSFNSFPVINIYQMQTVEQSKILDNDAKELEYFIKSRIELEQIFKDENYRPKRWENYRPLWYRTFSDEYLPNNTYGQLEKVRKL